MSTEDGEGSGRPKEVVSDENIKKIYKMTLNDRKLKLNEIVGTLKISTECEHHIIHEYLGIRVSGELTFDQKQRRFDDSEQCLKSVLPFKETLLNEKTYFGKQNFFTIAGTFYWKMKKFYMHEHLFTYRCLQMQADVTLFLLRSSKHIAKGIPHLRAARFSILLKIFKLFFNFWRGIDLSVHTAFCLFANMSLSVCIYKRFWKLRNAFASLNWAAIDVAFDAPQ